MKKIPLNSYQLHTVKTIREINKLRAPAVWSGGTHSVIAQFNKKTPSVLITSDGEIWRKINVFQINKN